MAEKARVSTMKRFAGTVVALGLAAQIVAIAPPAEGARPAKNPIVLSADPDMLELRPCTTKAVNIGIHNVSSEPQYVEIFVHTRAPLTSSREIVATYIPAGYKQVVPVDVMAPRKAKPGLYELTIETGEKGKPDALTVPVQVMGLPCLPRDQMSATATSWSPGYEPEKAIDGDPATLWNSRYKDPRLPLPQAITLELGGTYDVSELVYEPRSDGNQGGIITAYNVYTSSDGESFTKVASGTWELDSSRKTAAFTALDARYIRLEATAGGGRDGGLASAAETMLFGESPDAS